MRALLLCAVVSCVLVPAAPVHASPACGSYAYAGVQTQRPVHGVSAGIMALQAPDVKDGHVAGWVGIASKNADGWIQVGLSAIPGASTNDVYLEYAAPGRDPQYTVLRAGVSVGERHRFAVSELASRPGWWQSSVDGSPAGRAVFLPGSHGRWRAQVLGESWNDNSGACNAYSYAFSGVALAPAPSHRWAALGGYSSFEDPGYTLTWRSASHFVASTRTAH
jgi:hypothetical protein